MKKLLENWNRFVLEEKVIHEISITNFNKIKNWLDKTKGGSLSFNKLFSGKKRMIMPFLQSDPTIEKIITFLKTNGWEVDLSNGIATREVDKEIPSGPRKGEKIRSSEKQKIGKLLGIVEDFIQKREELLATPTQSNAYKEVKQKAVAANERLKRAYPHVRSRRAKVSFTNVINSDLMNFWNQKSEFYRKNPASTEVPDDTYSILMTRHPIDILRMSDFDNIQSCHSEGGDYFDCAVDEARGHGVIAYLVNTKDLKNVDLEDEEVFADRKRGIKGITPLARLRLRKFVNLDHGWELAMPERKVYGLRVPGFREQILKWAQDNQEEVISWKKFGKQKENDEIIRFGGLYGDSDDGDIFDDFFGVNVFSGGEDVEHLSGDYEEVEDDEARRETGSRLLRMIDDANKTYKRTQIIATPAAYDSFYIKAYTSFEPISFSPSSKLGDESLKNISKNNVRWGFLGALRSIEDASSFEEDFRWNIVQRSPTGDKKSAITFDISLRIDPGELDNLDVEYFINFVDRLDSDSSIEKEAKKNIISLRKEVESYKSSRKLKEIINNWNCFLLENKILTPTNEKTWQGGQIYKMNVEDDKFIHFAPKERLEQILETNTILMNPPYKKFGIDAVTAVSLTYGDFVPDVQTSHSDSDSLGAIIFETKITPKIGYIEEVIWEEDVRLINPKLITFDKAVNLLRKTVNKIEEHDAVLY